MVLSLSAHGRPEAARLGRLIGFVFPNFIHMVGNFGNKS